MNKGLVALFERLSLPGQVLASGGAFALVALAVAAASGRIEPAALAALALAAGGATLSAAWPAQRVSRGAQQVAAAARALTREEAIDDTPVPYLSPSREVHALTLALRRAFELARQRRVALMAQVSALGVQLQSRTQQLSSLQDLSINLAGHKDLAGLVDEALGALEQTMPYSSASVWARAELQATHPVVLMGYRSGAEDLAGVGITELSGLRLSRGNLQRYEQIEQQGLPVVENRPRQSLFAWLWEMVTDDARTSALYRGTRAWMAVPLKVRDRVFGVLRVDGGEADWFDAERERLLAAVGSQTALAMRHAQLLSQEREVAVVAERNRIARDLHDAVSQTLFASQLLAGTMSRAEGASAAWREQAVALEKLNRSALAELRMMLFELRPEALHGVGLAELLQHAVEALAGRGEVEVVASIDSRNPPQAMRIELYRVAQEALSNVGRHSGASHAQVSWSVPEPGQGVLRVADDGRGFDPEAGYPGHLGLVHLRERAAALGAELTIRSAPGEGTELRLTVRWN